jgi:hypothetical protein
MPWMSDEVVGWEEMSEEERDAFRAAIRDLGMSFPDEDDDDYYE